MVTTITHQDKENAIIQWRNKGFSGYITIKYNGDGSFLVDAEYVSIKTLIKIIKSIENDNR